MISDFLRFSYESIKKRKLRSALTMIGIFIGIAAVVSLISLGQGLQIAIEDQFKSLGGDKLIVTPGAEGGLGFGTLSAIHLTERDLKVIRRTDGVYRAAEMFYSTGRVKFKDQINNLLIVGLPTTDDSEIITEMQGFEAELGRQIEEGDTTKVAIGWRLWNQDLFDDAVGLKEKLEIEGQKFEVVGLIKRIGNPQDDAQVYIPIEKAKELFNKTDEVLMIFVQTNVGEDPNEVAENIKKELRRSRNEKEGEESFGVQTFENIINTFNSIFGIVQAVLIGIAAISLLVGGIGIMNTMYMTVLEHTREIGVMKAIGAKNSHIMQIFLFESGIYGMVGGIVGVLIGIGIAKLTELIAGQLLGTILLKASITPTLIISVLVFSFVVGMLSGAAPAHRASKLVPVQALRYE